MVNIGEIFAEYWQKTARPAEILGLNGPARPGSVHLNLRAVTAQFVKPEIYNPEFLPSL